jgi:hypothetical protein
MASRPEQLQSHFRRCNCLLLLQAMKEFSCLRYAGGLALQVVYGYKPSPEGPDSLLDLAEECMDLLANRISPSGSIWLVDVFPFRASAICRTKLLADL